MANFIQENLPNLKPRHYLLLANQANHWFNAYPGVVNDYRARYGDDFCLVLWRSGPKDDAYVLPYSKLKNLFVDKNLVSGPKKTLRWHGQVKDGHLALMGGRGKPVSVDGCHNAFDLLNISADVPVRRVEEPALTKIAEITFGLERDLQQGLRANIQQLESGLKIVDGGNERATETGWIDITAQDAQGRTVVIELKAGTATPEALTQLLAYMAAIGTEQGKRARGILVAGDFHPRLIRAASVVENVLLLRYRFNFIFERVQ